MKKRFSLLSALIAGAVILSGVTGCSTQRLVEANVKQDQATMSEKIAEIRNAAPGSSGFHHVEVVDGGIWMGDKSIKPNGITLPAFFDKTIELNRTDLKTLSDVIERVTQRTGIPVIIKDDAASRPGVTYSSTNTATTTQTRSTTGTPQVGVLPTNTFNTQGQGAASGALNQRAFPTYTGSLKGLLDLAASRYGVYWKWDAGQIIFFLRDTKTFTINSLPTDIQVSAQVANSGASSTSTSSSSSGVSSSGSVSANSGQNTKIEGKLSAKTEIVEAVKAHLDAGDNVVYSPATALLTVTAAPATLEKVAETIETYNRSLTRQVIVKVKVYSFTKTDTDDYGIDWSALYTWANKNVTFGLSGSWNAGLSSSTTNQMAVNILSASTSPWKGTSWIVKALSEQGQLSLITSAEQMVLNNRASPLFVGTNTVYLAKRDSTLTDSSSQVSIEPGTVMTGFSMLTLPTILDKDRLLLQFAIDISSLLKLTTIGDSTNFIQGPETDLRQAINQVALRSGQTIVISGLEQSKNQSTKGGVGSADLWALGGGLSAKKTHEMVIIMITPVITGS